MKTTITKIRTIRLKAYPNCIWVEIETEDGLKGLGEAWRGTEAVETVIHKEIAPWLLGQDARRIEMISRTLLTPYVGFNAAGAETRAASAIDVALWDLFGKRCNIPVYEALGGAFRTEMPVYNTCSGYAFNASASQYNSGATRRVIQDDDEMRGPYDDQVAFMKDAGKLAESLLSEGITTMKIWPFDVYAKKTNGNMITAAQLEEGLIPFKKIRDAVGHKMEIMCELHSLWSLPAAERILNALEPYDILWVEDPICKMDNFTALADLRNRTKVPVCSSETLSGAVTFRQMFEAGACDYAMLDLCWCGGLTEGRKIAALAESYNIPIAPHDCTGPVLLWAGLHLGLHSGAAIFQEIVRANIASWYQDIVDVLPDIRDGFAHMPTAPGLGCRLKAEVYEREDAVIIESGK